MRRLTVAEHISLDGVVQAPGGPDEDPGGDFRHGGWIVPYSDDVTGKAIETLHAEAFELLLGRRTYDLFAGYWPQVAAESPSGAIADVFNAAPKRVATHRREGLAWHNSQALEGDLASAVAALKRGDGADLLTWGSADMVRQLLAAGLVDELRLLIYPVMLGRGKRLFDSNSAGAAFELADSVTSPSGVLITRYLNSGAVRTGRFASH